MPNCNEIPDPGGLSWVPADVLSSLNALRAYAECQAQRQIDWYYGKKKWKSRTSMLFRLISILSFTLGGIAPIFKAAIKPGAELPWHPAWLDLGQSGYLAIAMGAGFIGLDRFFGFSSGWMRYITTAFAIEKSLEEFRFDWTGLISKLSAPPTFDQIHDLIDLCKQFSMAVKNQVEQETKAWVTEFQTNLTQLEKDIQDRVEASKTEIKTKSEAARSGAVSITVTNGASVTDGFTITVDDVEFAKNVKGSKAEIMPVPPGMHKVHLWGMVDGKELHASEITVVAAGDITKTTFTLV